MNSSIPKFAFFLLLLVGCTSSVTPSISAPRYKLLISSDGLYRVMAAALRDAGANLDGVDPASLQLFHGDREVAIHMQDVGAGSPRPNWSFEFYGKANDSPYSAFNVYWLRWGVQNGKRMREVEVPSATGAPKESFQDTMRVTRPSLYIVQAGDPSLGSGGAHWFWQSLTAPATTTITVTLPAAVPGQALLRVNLWGHTQDTVTPDHHLTVFFNNERVADETWDGQGAHSIGAAIPTTAVKAGENMIRLVAPGDTRAQADVVLLHSIEVTYTRRFAAQNDALAFTGSAGNYRVEGFSGAPIDLFDITDPDEPAHISNPTLTASAITFGVDASTPRRWLAIGPTARKPVARIAPMRISNLQSTNLQSDYIIITHPDFVDALQPLVKWRAERGLKVTVVTTNEIYDEFGYGAESPLAIRAFLDWAQRQWARPAPRFVLLVGKASYDYRDYQNGPNKNLLPTFLVKTPHLGQAASDNWFVAADEATGRPALAIGRIPAKTPDQVARVVNKTIAYESAVGATLPGRPDWRRRAIFVADDKEPQFVTMSDALAAKTPPGIEAQRIYLAQRGGDVTAARAEIVARWNAGALLLTYIGHSSIDTWAEGPLFSAENLGEIKNGERLPILFTPTCLDGFFYHPQKDSLAEGLLFKNDGGIVAGLVPTGLSLPDAQDALMRAVFAELFENSAPTPSTALRLRSGQGSGRSLGEAVTRAKQKMQGESPEMREVIETFALLGDPALRVTSGE